jgi:hypothetical protein
MVVRRKRRGVGELAGQEAARERDACEDSDFPCQRFGEDAFGRLEAEQVEDDLDALHVRVAHRVQRFLDDLHAHAVVAELAGPHQIIQDAEHLVPRVER